MWDRITAQPLLYGLLVAVVTGLAGSTLMAFFFFLSSTSEAYLQPAVTAIYLLGAFAGGFLAAKKTGSKGVLIGCETGAIYFFIILLVLLLIAPGSLSALPLLLRLVYTLAVAVAGGVFGIAFTD